MAEKLTKRDEILRCAQALIIAGGYNGFSYADIAKVVGIRKASIHHHFPTKAELVRELVVQYRGLVSAGFSGLDRQYPDALQRLESYVRYWEACIANGSLPICVCALLATEIPVLPIEIATEVREHFKTLSAWLTCVLRQGAKNKQLHLHKPATVEAEMFMASVHGALLSSRVYGDPKLFGTVIQPMLARFSIH